MVPWMIALAAVALGWLAAWLFFRTRSTLDRERLGQRELQLAEAEAELRLRRDEAVAALREQARLEATLENERNAATEKLALLDSAGEELKTAFRALSSEALQSNNRQFLDLAHSALERFQTEAKGDLEQRQKSIEHLLGPLRQSLESYTAGVRDLENSRRQDYGRLAEQVAALMTSNRSLQSTTDNLVKALRQPVVRGRWGEIQLRKVVELAGMVPWCDFTEQETLSTGEGRLRPDLIVKLPGGKQVVVDAKAPLQAYLDALEAAGEAERAAHLADHARQIRDHLARLGAKAYWDQFPDTPEFVVMFLPGEMFFSEALRQDPTLIEQGVSQKVILATPTTLIALLKAVAYGWRQEKIARNAQEISDLGRELHDRLRILAEHIAAVGKNLNRAVESYNGAVSSLEGRLFVSARRFTELGCGSTREIPDVPQVERQPRSISTPEPRDAALENPPAAE